MLNCEEEMGGVFVTLFLQGHSCALSNGGAVSCWGYNYNGQVMLGVLCFEGGWLREAGGGEEMFLWLTRCFVFVCSLATASGLIATRPFLFLVWAAGSR